MLRKAVATYAKRLYSDEDPSDELVLNTGLRLHGIQAFIRDIISTSATVKRIMMMWDTGMGKTIGSLAPAMEFIKYIRGDDPVGSVFVIGFTANAFKRELLRHPEFGFVSHDELAKLEELNKLAEMGTQVDHEKYADFRNMIKKRLTNRKRNGLFRFIGYRELVNHLFIPTKNQDLQSMSEKDIHDQLASGELKINEVLLGQFDQSMIIADEIHNVYNSAAKNNWGVALQVILNKYPDIRAIFLSATPFNNSPTEFVDLINLLDPIKHEKEEFFEGERLKPGALDKMAKLVEGKFSYVRDTDYRFMPKRVIVGEQIPGIPYLRFIRCEMSPFHYSVYKANYHGALNQDERYLVDFALPRPPLPDDQATPLGLFRTEDIRYYLKEADYAWKVKNKIDTDGERISGEILRMANLGVISKKYKTLVRDIIRTIRLGRGKIMVVHPMVQISGVLTIGEIFNENGLIDDASPPGDNTLCQFCGYPRKFHDKKRIPDEYFSEVVEDYFNEVKGGGINDESDSENEQDQDEYYDENKEDENEYYDENNDQGSDDEIIFGVDRFKKYGGGEKYKIIGSVGLNQTILRELLDKLFININISTSGLIYLHMELTEKRYDHSGYQIISLIKNILSNEKSAITDKSKLYENIDHKYLCETRSLDSVKEVHSGEVLIVKPIGIGAAGGNGISIINNTEELIAAKKLIKDMKFADGIVCKYITNPLLFKDRKFHIRRYILVSTTGIGSVFDYGWIYTAKEKYVNKDYGNKDIHDSHFGSTDKDYVFPECLKNQDLISQSDEIAKHVCDRLLPYAKSYPESKHAYEVFGLDIMFDDQHRGYLLEVNDKVGYRIYQAEENEKFSQNFYKWITDNLKNIIKESDIKDLKIGGRRSESKRLSSDTYNEDEDIDMGDRDGVIVGGKDEDEDEEFTVNKVDEEFTEKVKEKDDEEFTEKVKVQDKVNDEEFTVGGKVNEEGEVVFGGDHKHKFISGRMEKHRLSRRFYMEHTYQPARYILAHAKVDKNTMFVLRDKFNHIGNLNGERYKIMLGARIIKESIDFNGTRNFYMASYTDNIPSLIQFIGRVIRRKALSKNKPHERTVYIKILTSSLPDGSLSYEEERYKKKMEVYLTIQKIEQMIHMNAIDRCLVKTRGDKPGEVTLGPLPYKVDCPSGRVDGSEYNVKYAEREVQVLMYIIKRMFLQRSTVWKYKDLWEEMKKVPFSWEVAENPEYFDENNFKVALYKLTHGLLISDARNTIESINDDNRVLINDGRYAIDHIGEYYMLLPVINDKIVYGIDQVYRHETQIEEDEFIDITQYLSGKNSKEDYPIRKLNFKKKFLDAPIEDMDSAVCEYGGEFHAMLSEECIKYVFDHWTKSKPVYSPEYHDFYFKMLAYYNLIGVIVWVNNAKDFVASHYTEYTIAPKTKLAESDVVRILASTINNWIPEEANHYLAQSMDIKNKINRKFHYHSGESKVSEKVSEKESKVNGNRAPADQLPIGQTISAVPRFYMFGDLEWSEVPNYIDRSKIKWVENSIIGYDEKSPSGVHIRFKLRNAINGKMSTDTRKIERGTVCSSKSKEYLMGIIKKLGGKIPGKQNVGNLCSIIRRLLINKEIIERKKSSNIKYFYHYFDLTRPEQ